MKAAVAFFVTTKNTAFSYASLNVYVRRFFKKGWKTKTGSVLFLVGFASEGRKKAAYGHVFYQKQLASIMSRSAKVIIRLRL